jgi:hypothetical protein
MSTEEMVREALRYAASERLGPMTALNVRNVIFNCGGPRLSAGQVRYALGRMPGLTRGKTRRTLGLQMTTYALAPSSVSPVHDHEEET